MKIDPLEELKGLQSSAKFIHRYEEVLKKIIHLFQKGQHKEAKREFHALFQVIEGKEGAKAEVALSPYIIELQTVGLDQIVQKMGDIYKIL